MRVFLSLLPLLLSGLLGFGCGDDDGAPMDAGRDVGSADAPALDLGMADTGGGGDASTDVGTDAGPPSGDAPDPDRVARVAARIAACLAGDGIGSWFRELYEDPRFYGPADDNGFAARRLRDNLACVDALTSCDGLFDCIGVSADGEACTEACTGDVLTVCDDGIRYQLDCGVFTGTSCDAAGLDCAEPEAPPGSVPCDVETAPETCSGDTPMYCADPGYEAPDTDCAALGLVCAAEGGEARCQGPTPSDACSFGGFVEGETYFRGSACDGDQLTVCISGGEAQVNCAESFAQGASCYVGAFGSYCGLGDECEPGEHDPVCDGTSVIVCNAGRLDTIDCVALGFEGCDPDTTLGCLSPLR